MSPILSVFADFILVVPLFCILLASVYFTFKTRFVQIRMLPTMLRLFARGFLRNKRQAGANALQSNKALFAAMSTTIGIGNIVGPAIAVRLGGPGALLGFLLAVGFGAATTFAEVTFAMHFRTHLPDGSYAGGPMQYLRAGLGRWASVTYAFFGAVLLVVWSSNQSNTLADILSSYHVSKYLTAVVITGIVLFYLISGIKRIGDLAAKLVPIMFFLYCGAALWIIAANAAALPAIVSLVFTSALSCKAAAGASVGLAIQKMLRWGLAKGIQASEAGVGTATIPHTQAEGQTAYDQGVLSMVSIYSVMFICTLSGLVTLLTGSWQDSAIPLGISLIATPLQQYFTSGKLILAVSAFLFALGTILGNAYNGSACWSFVARRRWRHAYHAVVGAAVFFGAIFDVGLVWAITDYFIIPVALLNIAGILVLSKTHPTLLSSRNLSN